MIPASHILCRLGAAGIVCGVLEVHAVEDAVIGGPGQGALHPTVVLARIPKLRVEPMIAGAVLQDDCDLLNGHVVVVSETVNCQKPLNFCLSIAIIDGKGGVTVPYPKAYLLHFSVGELSCQLLRAIGVQRTAPPDPTNFFAHKHPFLELHYIMKGRFCYASGQTTYEAGPNQLLLIPPGTEHQLKQVSAATHRLIVSLYIQPPPKRTQSPSHLLYAALYPPSPLLLDVPPDSLPAEALEHICSLTEHDTLDFTMLEAMRAYASLLLAGLSGLLVKEPAPALAPTSEVSAPQSFLIDQFFYHPSLMKGGAPDLAEMLRVSPRQLDRILLDLCGMNFREKMNQAKLNYAIDLLTNQSLGITQIAHILNYSSTSSFSAFIKSATGMTPSQLRQSLLSGEYDDEPVCGQGQRTPKPRRGSSSLKNDKESLAISG